MFRYIGGDFYIKRSALNLHCKWLNAGDPARRGAQLSLRIGHDARGLVRRLAAAGVVCDYREPDIVRAAPAPFYTRFADVVRFAEVLRSHVQGR